MRGRPFEQKLTGHQLEEEVLGEVNDSERFDQWIEHRDHCYLQFNEAVEAVKKCQPAEFDPQEPTLPFPLRLHTEISERLGIDWQDLSFYTCVHFGEMDFRRGIDAIFEIKTEFGPVIISMDVTGNRRKDETRADVLITWPSEGLDPSLEEDRDEWERKINETSQDIIRQFRKRVANRKKNKIDTERKVRHVA